MTSPITLREVLREELILQNALYELCQSYLEALFPEDSKHAQNILEEYYTHYATNCYLPDARAIKKQIEDSKAEIAKYKAASSKAKDTPEVSEKTPKRRGRKRKDA